MGGFKGNMMTLQSHVIKKKSHRNVMLLPRATGEMTFHQDMCTGGDLGKCPSKVRKKSNVNPLIRRMSELNLTMSAGIKKC